MRDSGVGAPLVPLLTNLYLVIGGNGEVMRCCAVMLSRHLTSRIVPTAATWLIACSEGT